MIALGLGEIDEAFRQLAIPGEQHSSFFVNFRVDPLFASLRSDQRFIQIVRCGRAKHNRVSYTLARKKPATPNASVVGGRA